MEGKGWMVGICMKKVDRAGDYIKKKWFPISNWGEIGMNPLCLEKAFWIFVKVGQGDL